MNQHIVRRDDGNPEIRLFASPGSPQVYAEIGRGGLSMGFHLTRYQTAELIAALQDVDAELAAREANGCPVCASDDTEHTPGEGCSYVPSAVSA